MDHYRLEKYGDVQNKLLATTVANRAAGMQDRNSLSGVDSIRNKSASTPARKTLSIPE